MLAIEAGQLPGKCAYVGPDPEQHLLFSRVSENFEMAGIPKAAAIEALRAFKIDASFYDLPLTTLSGGERMRVVLAVATQIKSDCYVFHCVLPWLDSQGRRCLFDVVSCLRDSCIVFLEHEVDSVANVIGGAWRLEATRLRSVDIVRISDVPTYQAATDYPCDVERPPLVLRFSDVSFFDYPESGRDRRSAIIKGAAFSLSLGKRYCLVGENGSGKSTVAKLIFRLVAPEFGQIFLCDRDLRSYSRTELTSTVVYLGQFPEHQIVFGSVEEYRARVRSEGNTVADDAIGKYFGKKCPVTALSLLDQKILILLSSIANTTRLIILDEPTWGLGDKDVAKLLEVLESLLDDSRSLLVITHNEAFARTLDASCLHLSDGILRRDGLVEAESASHVVSNDTNSGRRFRSTQQKASRYLTTASRSVHLILKVSALAVLSFAVMASFHFIPETDMVYYSATLIALLAGLLVLLRLTVPIFEFQVTLSFWAFGAFLYFLIAIPLTAVGISVSPWLEFSDPIARWLYVLSFPFRILAIISAGLVFINSVSPLEFRPFGRIGKYTILLFRAIEYCKTAFRDTADAMLMLARWPEQHDGFFGIRTAIATVRHSPLLVATVIRNLLVWALWAWSGFSKSLNLEKKSTRKG